MAKLTPKKDIGKPFRQKARTDVKVSGGQIQETRFKRDGSIGQTTQSVGKNFAANQEALQRLGLHRIDKVRDLPAFQQQLDEKLNLEQRELFEKGQLKRQEVIDQIIEEHNLKKSTGAADLSGADTAGGKLKALVQGFLNPIETFKAADPTARNVAGGVGAAATGVGIFGLGSRAVAAQQVGKASSISGQISKDVAARFANNVKSKALTKNWLLKAGFTIFAADKLFDAFGTYPWAAHNNREATDTLVFGMRKALNSENFEEYNRLSEEFNVMVANMPAAWAQIPYKNVVDSSVKGINNAISVKNSMDVELQKLQGGI